MSDCRKKAPCLFPRAAFAALALLCAGCASTQARGIPTYYISGVPYVPLDAVCAGKGIRQDYDGLTRTVSLARDSQSVRFQVGSRDVLFNGRMSRAIADPDFYKGMVVIPAELRQRIDEMFAALPSPSRALSRLGKVVIDPGHGGKDPGATGHGGLEEKDAVLDIGRRLRDTLRKEGVDVIMTRSSDVFIPLEKRAEIANDAAADLFISIHANANRSRSLKGFEVYYISPAVSDAKRAVSAARSEKLRLDPDSLSGATSGLKAILWDMTYAYDRRESIELSRMLCRSMRGEPDTKVLGVKNANFCVLRDSTMPAVLIEVGYLTNPSEEALLDSAAYRQKLAERIRDGVRYYCEGLPAQQAPAVEESKIVKGGP